MHIDFHTHANLSRKSPITLDEFMKKMEEASLNGLDALALTENVNHPNFTNLYNMLDNNFSYENDYYDVNGLKVFPGMQVDVKDKGSFLIIANRETVRLIYKKLSLQENGIHADELMELVHHDHVLKIAAHPLRESHPWLHHKDETLKQFDALEINGKDLYRYGNTIKTEMEALASHLQIGAVSGSSADQRFHYGCIFNEIPECTTIDQLKKAILEKEYKVHVSPFLHPKIKAANFVSMFFRKKAV
ncbi:PHP domain-containing protein [Halobacillus sp. A5]|uniref:PHP domain-containing protein n=1 Tax=Halobacillus sp. A5 TaxID=2880263 RepID=UPI0020A6BF93|nr:PHP domain-containing protein [Halobacillus sp. A5]MCP3027637.1 histidinol-phosphatase [Halobacillus sp. A5]